METFPRISFGMIVLNGEPFTRYCLRSLYPFAHEIIVVEGGHEDARSVCTPDGHSIDGTLEALGRFKQEEDPENKVQIVTRDGFWPKRDELGRDRTHQSRAYAERATGDYLWQVDIDEFYQPEDIRAVLALLSGDPSISVISFNMHTFWGDLKYRVDGWRFRRGIEVFRVFKWGPGYRYVTHEPPTVWNQSGHDLRTFHWVAGKQLARRGIYMYHYSFLFPWQVSQKVRVYEQEKPESCSEIVEWAERCYFRLERPYRIDRHYWYPSWLERFEGRHPDEVVNMMDDVRSGRVATELRPTNDVEKLLDSRLYRLGAFVLKAIDPLDRLRLWVRLQLVRTKNVCCSASRR